MADYAVKRIDDMDAIYGGAFKRARAELGIRSFGLQVLDLPPNADSYPEHDHAEDGQEEVYVVPQRIRRGRDRRRAPSAGRGHHGPRQLRHDAQAPDG